MTRSHISPGKPIYLTIDTTGQQTIPHQNEAITSNLPHKNKARFPASRVQPSMDLDEAKPLQAFKKFWGISEFFLKDHDVTKWDQYHKIVYLICPKGIEAWKSFTWEDNADKEDPAKVFVNFDSSFQTTQNAMELKIRGLKPKAAGRLYRGITRHRTNKLLKCGYPQDQMDNRKVEIRSNARKHFDMKCYIRATLNSHIPGLNRRS